MFGEADEELENIFDEKYHLVHKFQSEKINFLNKDLNNVTFDERFLIIDDDALIYDPKNDSIDYVFPSNTTILVNGHILANIYEDLNDEITSEGYFIEFYDLIEAKLIFRESTPCGDIISLKNGICVAISYYLELRVYDPYKGCILTRKLSESEEENGFFRLHGINDSLFAICGRNGSKIYDLKKNIIIKELYGNYSQIFSPSPNILINQTRPLFQILDSNDYTLQYEFIYKIKFGFQVYKDWIINAPESTIYNYKKRKEYHLNVVLFHESHIVLKKDDCYLWYKKIPKLYCERIVKEQRFKMNCNIEFQFK